MFLAIAVLLIQGPAIPHSSFQAASYAEDGSVIETTNSPISPEFRLPLMQDHSDTLNGASASDSAKVPGAAELPSATTPSAITLPKPNMRMTVSVAELHKESLHNGRVWLGLAVAAHSAATFDAWSTRHAITANGAQEANPLLKPFAGNASIYLAIQAGPALMDFVGRKMMYSRHTWVRRMWWVPQTASIAGSLFCGVHNLSVR